MATYARAKSKKKDKAEKSRRADVVLRQLQDWADLPNVAEEVDSDMLATIGSKVVREYQIDETSRGEWKEKAEKALERAKLKRSRKTYPFDGAANVKYPLLTTAALQFAARAYPAIVEGQRVVKGQVVGDDPNGDKRSKADRISKHMSYQLINEMPEWEEDTDTLLHQLPIVGCCFRKVFYDRTLKRNRSEMVSALDLCVNQKTRSMETVPRISQVFELYPHEIEERAADGVFINCDDLGTAQTGGDDDEDAPHEFIEQHRYLDLDEDGYREPWIVTVHKETEKVVRIVANFDPAELKIDDAQNRVGRIARYNVFVKYPFFRDPDGGFYDLGLGELLESMSEVIDSTINQMLDAGHLQNAGGGFIGSGLRLKKNQMRFAPGQYHVVDAAGSKVREAIYNMEHPGPSAVLFNLLGMMIEAGKEISQVKDILSGDVPRQQPATTTLAMIEQGMKVYTSIYKRIHRSLKKEYGLLFALNAKFLPEQSYFTVMDSQKAVQKSDYEAGSLDVVPVSDPNIVTDMQRMTRAQAYLEAANAPSAAGVLNIREAWLRYFEGIGSEDIEKLVLPEQTEPSPEQQLGMQGAAAEVGKKEAEARKTDAEATIAEEEAHAVRRKREAEDFERELAPGLQAIMGGEMQEGTKPNGHAKPKPKAQQRPNRPEFFGAGGPA